MEGIRASILEKRFDAFRRDFLDRYQPANEAARQAQKEQWLQTRGG
jgi:queuine/archaeosine tRNA-ribosyltransferase